MAQYLLVSMFTRLQLGRHAVTSNQGSVRKDDFALEAFCGFGYGAVISVAGTEQRLFRDVASGDH